MFDIPLIITSGFFFCGQTKDLDQITRGHSVAAQNKFQSVHILYLFYVLWHLFRKTTLLGKATREILVCSALCGLIMFFDNLWLTVVHVTVDLVQILLSGWQKEGKYALGA